MPKVEVSKDHLERIAQAIGAQAEQLPQGSKERAMVERVLMNEEKMLGAFIDWHTRASGS